MDCQSTPVPIGDAVVPQTTRAVDSAASSFNGENSSSGVSKFGGPSSGQFGGLSSGQLGAFGGLSQFGGIGSFGGLGGFGKPGETFEITYKKTEKKPKTIGKDEKYLIGTTLGEGCYGKVREGIDQTSLRRVAIKTVKRRLLKKIPDGENHVKKEISVLKKLKHKHVVELIEVINNEEKEKQHVVLELITGGSVEDLREKYDGGKFPVDVARSITVQLVKALEYCHSQGVIHRDVKPDNLMLTVDGILKLADFSVAEVMDHFQNHDKSSNTGGAAAFAAPEVALGTENFSGTKVDIWAAGVCLYMFVVGRLPFEGRTVADTYELIGRGEYTIPPDVDEEVASLIRGMMCVDVDKRLTLDDIRQHPWLANHWDISHIDAEYLDAKVSKLPYVSAVADTTDDPVKDPTPRNNPSPGPPASQKRGERRRGDKKPDEPCTIL